MSYTVFMYFDVGNGLSGVQYILTKKEKGWDPRFDRDRFKKDCPYKINYILPDDMRKIIILTI